MTTVLELRSLEKRFSKNMDPVIASLNLKIQMGEFISLTGRSGSGKSTLLYLMSTLDPPSDGSVLINDRDTTKLTPAELHEFRNTQMGFVFQFHYLLPELTALENILMPARKTGVHEARANRALDLLHQFGLSEKQARLPRQLSGGEQQRVAIARSLIMEPRFLFCDEPTGNLDSASGQVVMDIFKELHRAGRTTLVMVTHERDYAAMAARRIELADGKIVSDQRQNTAL